MLLIYLLVSYFRAKDDLKKETDSFKKKVTTNKT